MSNLLDQALATIKNAEAPRPNPITGSPFKKDVLSQISNHTDQIEGSISLTDSLEDTQTTHPETKEIVRLEHLMNEQIEHIRDAEGEIAKATNPALVESKSKVIEDQARLLGVETVEEKNDLIKFLGDNVMSKQESQTHEHDIDSLDHAHQEAVAIVKKAPEIPAK